MTSPSGHAPARAWVVTFAGTAVNLCLGILYAWSVWKAHLVATPGHPAGSPMTGPDEGWTYLTDAQATWAYAGGRRADAHAVSRLGTRRRPLALEIPPPGRFRASRR